MSTYFTTITGNNQGIAMNPMLKSYHRNVRQVLPERFVIYISLDNAHFPKNEMPDTKWKISSNRWITARFPHINRSQTVLPCQLLNSSSNFFQSYHFFDARSNTKFLIKYENWRGKYTNIQWKTSKLNESIKILGSYILFGKIEIANWNSP